MNNLYPMTVRGQRFAALIENLSMQLFNCGDLKMFDVRYLQRKLEELEDIRDTLDTTDGMIRYLNLDFEKYKHFRKRL